MNNSLARNIVRTFSTQVGAQIFGILAGIVIARELGPSGKGFASYAATALSLVSVFFWGFGDAVLYQFGKHKRDARAVHTATLRILAAVLGIIVPVLVAVALLIPSQLPLAAAAIAIPFAMYQQMMTPFLMVCDKIAFVNTRTLVQSFGTALVTIPLLMFTHAGLTGVIVVWVFFYVVAAAQSAWGMRPILAAAPADGSPVKLVREQLAFGTRAAGSAVAGFLNMRINIFVVSIMFSPAALGWYTLAIGSGELLWQVSRAFVWSAVGRIGSDPFDESALLVARLTRNTLAIVGSLGVLAFVAGPWLIVHVYGQSFEPAGATLRWALPGLVIYAAEVALTKFIVLQLARPLATVWIQSAAATLCAAITFLTAGHFGIVAAAAATSLTYLVVTVVLIALFVRGTGVPLEKLLLVQRDDVRHYVEMLESMLRTLRLRSA